MHVTQFQNILGGGQCPPNNNIGGAHAPPAPPCSYSTAKEEPIVISDSETSEAGSSDVTVVTVEGSAVKLVISSSYR